MLKLIRARVYEIQWGGSVMPYVRYFIDLAEIESFKKETGYREEIL
ncbi:hypothetical protein [Paenibacillus sedimenti]|uniref:Uncharacterized protein n=1 Tax=Paenibacillus sedimenti TaxID=2770274 RepID=A0A926KQY7_9BACL|nr:hypothetical protein [Paenibacillus sedimenti]MBD0381306.1 hypothetical protein [Paenibacillus sedimenti]